MARLDPSWSDAYAARIARIESELGRFICGAVLPDGSPCQAEPEKEGRCAAHSGGIFAGETEAVEGRRTRVWLATAVGVVVAVTLVGTFIAARRDPAEKLWSEATVLLASGKSQEAEALLKMLQEEYPSSEFAVRAERVLDIRKGVVPITGESPTERKRLEMQRRETVSRSRSAVERAYYRARNYYLSRNRSDKIKAAALMLAVADSYPGDPRAADALFDAAQLYNVLGLVDDEIRAWQRLVSEYPGDGRVPEALYALGYVFLIERGEKEKADEYFGILLDRYGQTSAAEAARNLLQPPESRSEKGLEEEEPAAPTIRSNPGGM
ncbi:MAG: hypothetical protein D6679_08110 [Candidatus Hydrogenedentota bacterium]|nr:MAG: hypothetical protein D6679_08110 [Candidatus Hydrogenedentota bacterium]